MRIVRRKGQSAPYGGVSRVWRLVAQGAKRCGCRCGHSGWIIDAVYRLDAVEAIEHGFNQDKTACTRLREACGGS